MGHRVATLGAREGPARLLRERPVRTCPAIALTLVDNLVATFGLREGPARLLRERTVRSSRCNSRGTCGKFNDSGKT